MGHDVSAYFGKREVAYLRRSAFDDANQVIYEVLGTTDLYRGCSGAGEWVPIDRDRFEQAEKLLNTQDFSGLKRQRNFADDLVDALQRMGATVVDNVEGRQPVDVEREKEFVRRCLEYMRSQGIDTLHVLFS